MFRIRNCIIQTKLKYYVADDKVKGVQRRILYLRPSDIPKFKALTDKKLQPYFLAKIPPNIHTYKHKQLIEKWDQLFYEQHPNITKQSEFF